MARIGYAGVSTRAQHEDSQLDDLAAAGCQPVYCDKASGKLATRPQWDECRRYLRAGDELVITRLSRLARSVRHLSNTSPRSPTTSSAAASTWSYSSRASTPPPPPADNSFTCSAIDEFSADLISEGTVEGLAAAKARGRIGGRPTVITPAKLQVARTMLDDGEHTMAEIARTIGVSRPTLYRHLQQPQIPLA
ncbi:MAG: recombinase family protein [Streptosporangiales bacterium]